MLCPAGALLGLQLDKAPQPRNNSTHNGSAQEAAAAPSAAATAAGGGSKYKGQDVVRRMAVQISTLARLPDILVALGACISHAA